MRSITAAKAQVTRLEHAWPSTAEYTRQRAEELYAEIRGTLWNPWVRAEAEELLVRLDRVRTFAS